ncbi:RNA 2',3'-cyclic phosphodiesterase [Sandaracinobacteroides hominis]|uniref:RNA 2',3'-cyclic phosphodiesterase n=1 Tax=Sandaracinobacteroides hominis TaxID=2780086 RepID=UPI0018F736C3|nr:RNA 2',3'-cyclic phosphodiesterase [Sandaracinobacteroides hominis]
MSHRLFVALRPPPEIRAALLPIQSGIEGARWLNDNQLHLTLAFLGEVDRHGAEATLEALESVPFAPLDLKLGQLGSFDSTGPGRTSALWVGVEPADALTDLATSVRTACRRAGLAPDARRFVPHITLARFSGAGASRETLRPWLETATPPPLQWRASNFHLVESILGQSGPHYEPLASYELVED